MTAENSSQYFVYPVYQMKVIKDSKVQPFIFRSETYHFCAEPCLKTFIADPEKYLKIKPTKRKGFWGRYLDRRLTRQQGGSH
jgi:YHS domain-containing protein